ncbi:lethal(3)malignant brain tumor-like protein 3 isoform X2 [Leptidea sinapis]|uniref:lethal(3)malignant brain tumor-like protein 3 isoform X2 n=1 Tax=Leptidea sinapis TaxID=189913 RepID=UPI00213B8092|nr:lethal(3)malignant brain tumor-like protein 3 isoform X2 [Leptidea sinapis]
MSSAAPPRAFKSRPPVGFKPGMKLEVVDKRVPFLIRVATISAVKGHQVRVSFDGWPDELSYWLEDDSPDIHPVGWCLKTGHPLEPPLTAEEVSVAGPCGVGGCRGLGSVRGGGHKQHAAASACPYRAESAARAYEPPDRLATRSCSNSKSIQSCTPTSDLIKEKLPRGRPPKHKRVEEVVKSEQVSDEESVSSSGKRRRGDPATEHSRPHGAPPAPHARFAAHVAHLALPADPALWTQKEVGALVSRVVDEAAGVAAVAARVGGAELLMASCEELAGGLRLRLGPAIKLYALVRYLRETLAAASPDAPRPRTRPRARS